MALKSAKMRFIEVPVGRGAVRLLELLPLWLIKFGARGFLCESGVRVKSPHLLELGHDVTIQHGSIIHCGGKKWCHYRGKVVLEHNVVIGPRCILYGSGEIHLGAYTHLGPGAIIMSQSGSSTQNRLTSSPDYLFEPVVVGQGCWIGAGAVLLGGTVLGDCCTVGPNSVVKGSYPDNTVLIGNPARPSATIRSQ